MVDSFHSAHPTFLVHLRESTHASSHPLQPRSAAGVCGPVWLVSRPQPTGPAEGTKLEGENTRTADPPHDSFRVGTFNIDGCKGADGRRDVDRVAPCLKDLDFVALNEVHGPRLWESDNQAACWAGGWACSGFLPRPRAIGTASTSATAC